jgi:hypothetical protein
MQKSFDYGRDALRFVEDLGTRTTAGAVMDAVERALARFGFENFNLGGLPLQCFEGIAVATRWQAGVPRDLCAGSLRQCLAGLLAGEAVGGSVRVAVGRIRA